MQSGRIGPAQFAVVAAGVNAPGRGRFAHRLRDSIGVELRAATMPSVAGARWGARSRREAFWRALARCAGDGGSWKGKWVRDARDG